MRYHLDQSKNQNSASPLGGETVTMVTAPLQLSVYVLMSSTPLGHVPSASARPAFTEQSHDTHHQATGWKQFQFRPVQPSEAAGLGENWGLNPRSLPLLRLFYTVYDGQSIGLNIG